jgi:predicted HNH restriction endonuclease
MEKRKWSTVRDAKEDVRRRFGRVQCEACGWAPHPDLGWDDMLHAHHMEPIAYGGSDSLENVVVLCPTCHALAHNVWRVTHTVPESKRGLRNRCGNRSHLLEHLRRLREAPDEFLSWARNRLK